MMKNTSHQDEQGKDAQSNAPSLPLFRPEVTASQSQQSLGAIRLAQPIAGWLVASVALAVTIGLIVFITAGSVTKKAHITGITVPVGGTISIVAASAGVVRHKLIAEGQSVSVGQTLFELSTERQGDQGEITQLIAQQLAARQHSLESEASLRTIQTNDKRQSLELRLTNLGTEARQLEQEITLTQRRYALAQDSVNKYQQLQASGYVSSAQTQQKQEDLIDIETRLSTLKRNKLQLESDRLSFIAQQRELSNTLATEQAQLQRALASLQQEIAENRNRKSNLITATESGIVTTINVQPGQMVSLGQTLATLIPHPAPQSINTNTEHNDDLLEVQLYAPSRTAGFVSQGQTVLIRYQAYPYQKFGLQKGTVTDVSTTPFAPNELPPHLTSTILSNAQQSIQGFNSNEALYRIKVKLAQQTIEAYGKAQRLKPGMTLEADVQQDKRKIWEWVLEPVLAVGQR
jgi:membrane fusion protein